MSCYSTLIIGHVESHEGVIKGGLRHVLERRVNTVTLFQEAVFEDRVPRKLSESLRSQNRPLRAKTRFPKGRERPPQCVLRLAQGVLRLLPGVLSEKVAAT
jgi:hypothetical protein